MIRDRTIPFPVLLSSIVLLVAFVAILAVTRPLDAIAEDEAGNRIGRPFGTGDVQYEVALVSADPVYTYTSIPFPPPGGYIPWSIFATITYLPGTGQFIVGGICHIGKNQPQNSHRYGMYAITDTGQLSGKRDVCLDTSDTARAGDWCGAETHRCTNIGSEIVSLPNGQFLRKASIDFGAGRPSAVYGTTGGTMELVARMPDVDDEAAPAGALLGLSNIAVANGRAIGIARVQGGGLKNAIYSLPDLQLITSFDKEYQPLVGVGEYFIAWKVLSGNNWEYAVYRMPASGTAKPTLVSTFSGKMVVGSGVIDTLDHDRIGLVLKDKATNALEFVIYNAGPDGLIEESRRTVPQRWMGTMTYPGAAMAGEYLAYGRCPSTSSLFEERAESCRVFVEKDGADLAVEQLPRDSNGRRRTVIATAISDTGRILVSTNGYSGGEPSAIGRIYLYDIADFDGSTPPPIPMCVDDSDCATGRCVAGTCAAECESEADCTERDTCVDNRCETAYASTASFLASSASCGIGFPRIFCVADVSWTSEGEGVIQLVQQGGRQRACAPAGVPTTKRIITTERPHTYQLYAAADCDSEPSLLLDAITVQASRD